MGKKEDRMYAQLLASIRAMQNPATNPAQNYLTDAATAASGFLQQGEFSKAPPKGMFFNFDTPDKSVANYSKMSNVGQGGTFALGRGSQMGSKVIGNQKDFLQRRFARDASQQYQNNIAGAAQNVDGALKQAAGAQSATNQNVVGALQGLYSSPLLNKPSGWGSVLGMAGQIGASALKFI